MNSSNHFLVELEYAERETRFCGCGDYMTPAADQDGIWLQCRTIENPDGGALARVLAFLAPHDRRLIVSAEDLAPADAGAPVHVAAIRPAFDETRRAA